MPSKFLRPSQAVALYDLIEAIPGFFNYDDAQHFSLVLGIQQVMGIKGDLMEIGAWKGRSAAFLSFYLGDDERLVLNDVFSAPATDRYPEYPSVSSVRKAILQFRPEAERQLVFLEGDSRTTTIPVASRFRFVHVDGGHSFEECYSDLVRVTPHVISGGVIAVDDYDHPDWPEVKPATDRWLAETPEFVIIGDMNRTVAKGDRKSTRLNSSHIQKSRMPSSA